MNDRPVTETTSEAHAATTVVWCITDGKAGHESQIRGLVASLHNQRPLEAHTIPVEGRWRGFWDWMRGRSSCGRDVPSPHLIVAAGHATHAAALAARRARGGRLVVLMRPSLPLRWFDLCLIPEHDLSTGSVAAIDNRVVTTCGVLNGIQPSSCRDERRALLLIGGPSTHYEWNEQALMQNIREVVGCEPAVQWTLTTSRRTPASFISRLRQSPVENLSVTPYTDTGPGWIATQLASARQVFVTEDSVSMIYESLSAGGDVGLLRLPRRRTSRVIRGIDRLVEEGLVIRFEEWRKSRFTERRPLVLREADRCARIVCERLLDAA